MAEIINVSNVTELSGDPPVITPSNPVTTVINDPPVPPCEYHCRCDCCCDCCYCCDCCCRNFCDCYCCRRHYRRR